MNFPLGVNLQRTPTTNDPSGHIIIPRPPDIKLPSGAICGPCGVRGTNFPFGAILHRWPPAIKLPYRQMTYAEATVAVEI